jgi:tetratricopeptide (TPR) repeat protein
LGTILNGIASPTELPRTVTDLSHSKDLFVVARNSTEVYRGKPADLRNVGRDLGVRYVLEGSIQPSGDQIRVTAQLIDARTGGHVWSNRYDRPATELFKVQSDATEKIAATLTGYEGAVAEAERSLIRRKPPSGLTAYETYLLGMEAKHTVTKDGLEEGERLLRKALEIDPQLARAYVGLAYVYEYRLDFGLGTPADNLAKLIEAARNAVRLDPNDGETQLVLGHAFAYQGMADQALQQFAKAESLAPHNADLLILIAWFIPQFGQPDRAVELAEKALQLNPNYPYWYNQGLRLVYFFGRQFDKSVKYAKLVTDPFATDYAYLAAASAMKNDLAAAKIAAAEVVRLDPNWSVEKYMSDGGGYPDDAAMLFIEGARKAGVAACVPADKLSSMPNLIHIKACDEERTHQAAG